MQIRVLKQMLARAQQTVVVDQNGVRMISNSGSQQSLLPAHFAGYPHEQLSTQHRPGTSHSTTSTRSSHTLSTGQTLSLTPPHAQPSQDNHATTAAGTDPALAEKLVECVNMIKELVAENSNLRQLYETFSEQHEDFEVQLWRQLLRQFVLGWRNFVCSLLLLLYLPLRLHFARSAVVVLQHRAEL